MYSYESKIIDDKLYWRLLPETTVENTFCGEVEHNHESAWISDEYPDDFICPYCNGTEWGQDSGIDWGTTTCKKCDHVFLMKGWAWFEWIVRKIESGKLS